MARLITESGGERREFLVKSPLVLGRHRTSGVVLEDPKLSREHARIEQETLPDGRVRYTLVDMESRNGTYLNDRLIRTPEVLWDGAVIRIGQTSFQFVLDEEEKASTSSTGQWKAPVIQVPEIPSETGKGPSLRAVSASLANPRGMDQRLKNAGTLLALFAAGTFGFYQLFLWLLRIFVPKTI